MEVEEANVGPSSDNAVVRQQADHAAGVEPEVCIRA